MVLTVVHNYFWSLLYASKNLQNDIELVIAALHIDDQSIEFASKN